VAELDFPIQVDVFARSARKRSQVVAAIKRDFAAGLTGGFPAGGGFPSLSNAPCVELPDYYGGTATFRLEGPAQNFDNPGNVSRREYRAILNVTVQMSELVAVDATRLTDLDLLIELGISTGNQSGQACPVTAS